MAKKRKVGNLLALAVLTVLVQRPMHPYEMASVLRERGKDQDMPIKWGSLYTVVRNLEKHGLVAEVGRDAQGGRPERTTYGITAAGRAEAEDWVRELVSTPEPELPRFMAGLSSLGMLGPDEVAELLRRRLDRLETGLGVRRDLLAAHSGEIPRLFLVEDEYDLAIRAAEIAWVRDLLADIENGTLDGLSAWRTWHDTGHVPEAVAELAERGGDTDR